MMNSHNDHPNLTLRARQALKFANEEAAARSQSIVSSEDLLVGLVRLNSGVAPTLLRELDVNLGVLRGELEERAEDASSQGPRSETDLERIIASATERASKCGNKYIGTEHLFYAIVSDETCAGAVLLRALGVENTTLRDEISRDL